LRHFLDAQKVAKARHVSGEVTPAEGGIKTRREAAKK